MFFVLCVPIICMTAGNDALARGISIESMAGWKIVVPVQAIPSETYGAEELQTFFEQATGMRLPITTDPGVPQCVYVGPSRAMAASALGFDTTAFGPEELRVVVGKSSIAIAGGRPRGTLYGVYTFLEDCLGVRFLTPDTTHVPRMAQDAVLRPMDKRFNPHFSLRFYGSGEIHRERVYAARMRANGSFGDVAARLGGKAPIEVIGHSFSRYVPWAKYGKTHPEYFNETNGKRPTETVSDHYGPGVQLCTTNPAVKQLITEGVLKDLKERPGRGNIAVSQNDGYSNCSCAECKTLDHAAGSHMGSLLAMVNDVADVVAQDYPDVLVGTLSYVYSQKTPKGIVPRPNVQIQLCSYETCLVHPMEDPTCPRNVTFHRDLLDWGKITENISVWCYVANFSNNYASLPLLNIVGPNIRLFARNNVKGIFAQGPESGANLGALRNYLICKLLWDPTRSERQLMDEFLALYYGDQAGAVRQYIDILQAAGVASDTHQFCFGVPKDYGLTPEVTHRALAVLEKAMASASDDVIRARLEEETVGCYGILVAPVTDPAYQKGLRQDQKRDDGTPFTLSPQDAECARPYLTKYFELCRKHGLTRYTDNVSTERLERLLREAYNLKEDEAFYRGGAVLLRDLFDEAPQEKDWTLLQFEWKQSPARGESLPGSAAAPATVLRVEDGYWRGPTFSVNRRQYYRVLFQSHAQVPGLWAVMFFDAEGKMLQADHNSGIDASEAWIDNEFFFQSKEGAVSARLWFYPLAPQPGKAVSLRDIRVTAAGSERVLAWADSLYATLPQVDYEPDDVRWSLIPDTMKKLQDSETLRIVILGDSIGNDTGNSPVDKLIERHYPGSEVKLITSVRGSTGCQYYRHENRVQDYVTRYKPDLVMITAISHGYDVESIRVVVRQIRAQNEAEIIVTSGPIGQDRLMIEGYAEKKDVSLEEAAAVHRAFLRDLRRMAKKERVEFIPLRSLWNDYLTGPAKECDIMWFMRDRTHANLRGRQVVARLLEKYFAPK